MMEENASQLCNLIAIEFAVYLMIFGLRVEVRTEYYLLVAVHWMVVDMKVKVGAGVEAGVEVGVEAGVEVGVEVGVDIGLGLGEWDMYHQDNCLQEDRTREYHMEVAVAELARRAVALLIFLSTF